MQSRNELHEAITRLADDQVQHVLAVVDGLLAQDQDPVRERMQQVPGVRMPARWRPKLNPVNPVTPSGELVSERLIRERR